MIVIGVSLCNVAQRWSSWPNIAFLWPEPMLVRTLVLLSVILLYTAWSYWVFRGSVRADVRYH